MGARPAHQAGTTWGRKGETLVLAATSQRFRCNVISSLTIRGVLRFRVLEVSSDTCSLRLFKGPLCDKGVSIQSY
jgi:hypothetical protein